MNTIINLRCQAKKSMQICDYYNYTEYTVHGWTLQVQ